MQTYATKPAEGGAAKNIKAVGGGLFEIKIDYQAGYRVYFRSISLVLISGSIKSGQRRDIRKANRYWSTANV